MLNGHFSSTQPHAHHTLTNARHALNHTKVFTRRTSSTEHARAELKLSQEHNKRRRLLPNAVNHRRSQLTHPGRTSAAQRSSASLLDQKLI
mmetsp:Transcript_42556/g.106012  ORF Transcript_42556/g.106012 Transcript_42556/m.106012 type:complete len:91 (+) Transcript_42556:63-335(+)